MSKITNNVVDISLQSQCKVKPIKKSNHIHFSDHPDFKPNLSPKEVLQMGSFGGTYFRKIYSQVVKKTLKDQHKEYPKSWFQNMDINKELISTKYDPKINKYKIKCGQSLLAWEESGWISNLDPYGWFQWYCRFYLGRRHPVEDPRQIQRWRNITGEKGRHRNSLITLIRKAQTTNNKISIHDSSISPARRQTLQHWGYKLTDKDFKERIKFLSK
tara:strand:+ start:338 stop:982 length:645 start_codon:yes stop_codon:yes gene_type:complete